jgi:hypothetical protein
MKFGAELWQLVTGQSGLSLDLEVDVREEMSRGLR